MNPLLFGICIVFIVSIILLGIMIYIYRKRNIEEEQYHQEPTKETIVNGVIHDEDKRHEDFMKSINVVHQDKTVIGTIYVNGKEEELSTKKEENGYIYYLGNTIIGGYNPDVMGDNLIVFRENTLENQLSDQIKDQIIQVIEKGKRRKEQEKERQAIQDRTRNIYEQQMG